MGRWVLCGGEELRQGVGDDTATKRERNETKWLQYGGGECFLEAVLKFSSFWACYRGKSNSIFKSNLYCHIFFTIFFLV